jgi:hypothetical protein
MRFLPLKLVLTGIVFATTLHTWAQTGCTSGDAQRTAMLALGIQNKLLAHKIAKDDIEIDAPKDVEQDVVMLRKSLDVATKAFFRCVAGDDTSPGSLELKLKYFLHADQSIRPFNSTAQDGFYGANLHVHIESAKDLPDSIFVVLNFGIECGDDNLLFLYTRRQGRWESRLHWYSESYGKPSDAFGDIYLYSIVPGPTSTPLVVVAHGHPWCTSRWSSFELDLLRTSSETSPQSKIGHFAAGYDRASDNEAHMAPTANGFTFKFWTNDAVPAKDPTQMSGPLTLRFTTSTGKLQCLSKACKSN